MNITTQQLTEAIKKKQLAAGRQSAWKRGVYEYAYELVESIEAEEIDNEHNNVISVLLSGARDWNQYSWGGCSLIYDSDIAERLCTPSELRKTRNGERRPNSREEWLDTQARALYQAACIVTYCAKRCAK